MLFYCLDDSGISENSQLIYFRLKPSHYAALKRAALRVRSSDGALGRCTTDRQRSGAAPKTERRTHDRHLHSALRSRWITRARYPLQSRLCGAPSAEGQVCPADLHRSAQVRLVSQPASGVRRFQATGCVSLAQKKSATEQQSGGAFYLFVSTRAALVAKQGRRPNTDMYMSAAVLPFKYLGYSDPVSAAVDLLARLAECPVPSSPHDQHFIDGLMARALRFTADGLRTGFSYDREGLLNCSKQIAYLAERTSASHACETAAREVAALRGHSGPWGIINAAANALDKAKC